MLKQLKRGDRIQTIGGIQGTVVTVEENRVAVKVDESHERQDVVRPHRHRPGAVETGLGDKAEAK